MRKIFHLGSWLGIPIKMHSSIVLTLGLLAYVIIVESLTTAQALGFAAYMTCLFICVLLHEYGHALMARRYGISTQDIILTPIGGIARLNGFPNKPALEIMVAIAGPLVNVVILLVVVGVLKLLGAGIPNPELVDYSIFTHPIGFLYMIMVMNGLLFLFNLIPAFPMDGGRIFRALLSFWFSKEKATFAASIVGRGFAIAFVAIGVYNKILVLVGVGIFVFFAAGMEYKALHRRS